MTTQQDIHSGSKILMVDDDEMVRKAFARAVTGSGFDVDVAKDSWAAMKLARRSAG